MNSLNVSTLSSKTLLVDSFLMISGLNRFRKNKWTLPYFADFLSLKSFSNAVIDSSLQDRKYIACCLGYGFLSLSMRSTARMFNSMSSIIFMKELKIRKEDASVISRNDPTFLFARCKSSNSPLILSLQFCFKEYYTLRNFSMDWVCVCGFIFVCCSSFLQIIRIALGKDEIWRWINFIYHGGCGVRYEKEGNAGENIISVRTEVKIDLIDLISEFSRGRGKKLSLKITYTNTQEN